MGRRIVSSLTGLCAVLTLGQVHSSPGTEIYSEESVKAAFIYRFAGYVDWPEEADSTQAFTIAVMGSNDILLRLQTLAVDRTLHNRPIRVRRISGLQDAGDAQILYIGPTHRADLKTLLQAIGGRNILVITDEEHGLDSGSTINFLMVDRRVRFEVSTEAAHRAGLHVSSELLSVAARVQGGRARPAGMPR